MGAQVLLSNRHAARASRSNWREQPKNADVGVRSAGCQSCMVFNSRAAIRSTLLHRDCGTRAPRRRSAGAEAPAYCSDCPFER